MEDEDHSSSESGWTMYIGSSIRENDHYNYIGEYTCNSNAYKQVEGNCKNRCRNYNNSQNDDESDDSMASDASSGPSNHYKFPCSSEQNPGMDRYKHEKSESTSSEKLQQQVNRREQRRNKKETLELKTTRAASHLQSRDKTKITNYIKNKV